MKNKFIICYFGIFDPDFSRNAVYIKGLRQNGIEVIICTDRTPGLVKYTNLIKAFWKDRKIFDAVVVGYSGHTIVLLAKILSLISIQKPVIFDALCSFYESNILSRDAFKNIPFRKTVAHTVDCIANMSADYILLETEAQRQYYIKSLKVSPRKCVVALTGVNDDLFYYDQKVKKLSNFTVLFRGKITPEAGIRHILNAAKILEGKSINFRIIGFGWGDVNNKIQRQVTKLNLKNVEFINKFLPVDELREKILECHVSLGQFEKNERLERTIPHKAFEAVAMKMPYITARAHGVEELFEDGVTCLFVNPADPEDLVQKIELLKNNIDMRGRLVDNGYRLYTEKLKPQILARDLISKVFPTL